MNEKLEVRIILMERMWKNQSKKKVKLWKWSGEGQYKYLFDKNYDVVEIGRNATIQ